jgi:hypothetical protein
MAEGMAEGRPPQFEIVDAEIMPPAPGAPVGPLRHGPASEIADANIVDADIVHTHQQANIPADPVDRRELLYKRLGDGEREPFPLDQMTPQEREIVDTHWAIHDRERSYE